MPLSLEASIALQRLVRPEACGPSDVAGTGSAVRAVFLHDGDQAVAHEDVFVGEEGE